MMARRKSRGLPNKYYGKYRGKVEDNEDPLFLGRIMARVAILPNLSMNWCMPCVPYAGPGVGFYAIPPIGANVWIEFEGGDLNFPIWTGCFWGEGEVPVVTDEPPNPAVITLKSEFNELVLNDTPEIGGFTVRSTPPAVDDVLSMTFDAIGITLSAPPASIKMVPEEGITLTFPPVVIAMSEDNIELTAPPSVVTITSEAVAIEAPAIDATAEEAVAVEAGADISLSAGGAFSAEAGGAASLDAGGDASLSGGAAVSIEAGAAATVTAAADVTVTAAIIMLN